MKGHASQFPDSFLHGPNGLVFGYFDVVEATNAEKFPGCRVTRFLKFLRTSSNVKAI